MMMTTRIGRMWRTLVNGVGNDVCVDYPGVIIAGYTL